MGKISLIEAMALLLSNPKLRKEFSISAVDIAETLNVNDKERCLFCALSVDQLNQQAELLIKKRMREVYKFLPLTFQLLGDRTLNLFNQFAISFWPRSYRRHQEDAWRFCQYLKDNGYTYNCSEWNRISFKQEKKKWKLKVVHDAFINKKQLVAIQLLFRIGHSVKEKQFYLGV